MIEKTDYLEAERLLKLIKFTKPDVESLETIMKKYVDPRCRVCNKCRSQIKFTLKRLENWFNSVELKIQDEVQVEVIDEVKIEVIDEVKRCHCGVELTDKRRKVCKDCK